MKERRRIMGQKGWKWPVYIVSCICIILIFTMLPFNLWIHSGVEYVGITSVRGDSMEPNIKNNDIMFIKPLEYSRGDVVALCPYTEKYPSSTNLALLKRIVGLPGETVAITKDGVTINGELLDEPWTNNANLSHREGNDVNEIVLSENEYFLLGDNRDNSFDSRHVGEIHKSRFLYGLTAEPNDYTFKILTMLISLAVTNVLLIVVSCILLFIAFTQPKAVGKRLEGSHHTAIIKATQERPSMAERAVEKHYRKIGQTEREAAINAKRRMHKGKKKKK